MDEDDSMREGIPGEHYQGTVARKGNHLDNKRNDIVYVRHVCYFSFL